MTIRAARILCLWLAIALLVACAPAQAPNVPSAQAPAEFPQALYRDAAARGLPVFAIDPRRSLVTVHVLRGGAFANFGHDHVISTRAVHGYLLLPERGGQRADLYVRLADLEVDAPAARRSFGLEESITERDIEATRANMLGPVLESERYPFVIIHAESAAPGAAPVVEISLHGQRHRVDAPMTMRHDANGLTISGRFNLRQSDFGITPYAVLGGALRVADEVQLGFELHAMRVTANSVSG